MLTSNHKGFAAQHPWDRNFFLAMAGLIWVGILMGFGGDMVHHFAVHKPPYPLIVHVHAAAFVGWLVLFTVQILLIRLHKYDLHKRLGLGMMALAIFMVFIGPAAELVSETGKWGTPDYDPAFMSVSFTAMIGFAGLVGAAVFYRKHSSAHKRLMFLATLHIASAGFGRWEGPWLGPIFGGGVWGMAIVVYTGATLLMLLMGLYDLVTRRKLHPAWVLGFAWVIANELTSTWLYHSPFWLRFTTHLTGH